MKILRVKEVNNLNTLNIHSRSRQYLNILVVFRLNYKSQSLTDGLYHLIIILLTIDRSHDLNIIAFWIYHCQ